MIFQKSEMYFKDKIELKSNGKIIRNRRPLFSLLFCSKLDLRLSWRQLRSILGRLGKILSRLGSQLGSNLDPKMVLELPKSGPRGAYRSPVGPLGPKNRPKAAQNLPKPAQGGAQTLSKSRFWGILPKI